MQISLNNMAQVGFTLRKEIQIEEGGEVFVDRDDAVNSRNLREHLD
jgi:hypothetical protein